MKEMKIGMKSFWIRVLISVITIFVSFLMLSLFSALVLSKIKHFENFYQLSAWGMLIPLSVLLAMISGVKKQKGFLVCLISAAIFSILSLALGLLLPVTEFHVWIVLIRYFVFIILSMTFAVVFFSQKTKGRKKRKSIPFSK